MRRMWMKVLAGVIIFGTFAGPRSLAAQTVNTATVLGVVSDQTGAVIPGAEVTLTQTATAVARRLLTNGSGQFVFANVAPGVYQITVAMKGFKKETIPSLTVDVAKSYLANVTLQVGGGTQVVEVTASAAVELQTTDAQIGNVVGGEMLAHLPTLQRNAGELLTLQPGVTPYDSVSGGGFGNGGGTVTGARSDQNSTSLDGIDITENVIAGGGNEDTVIPIGIDAIEEFRVGITNANATFGRSAGGQIALVSKSGTNSLHGAAYWYHQNDNLNAASWTDNRNGVKKQELKDNRAGFALGGPIRKDKTFFFGNYEFRRFPQSFSTLRLVPSTMLKQGIVQFGGVPYDLQTSTACGPNGNAPCDPRGLGISPTVQALWNLMPPGTDKSAPGSDGVNTIGFRSSGSSPRKADSVAFRLDHNFSEKAHFFGRYAYSRDLSSFGGQGQVDIRGGATKILNRDNIRGDGYALGFDYQFRPTLLNSFRMGWIRSRQDFPVEKPSLSAASINIPGTASPDGNIALAPVLAATGYLDAPIDVDTQRARNQSIIDSSKQYVDNLTWIKGHHAVTTGADIRWLPTIHKRDDKVIGSVNSLVATMDADVSNFLTIPAQDRPPTLSATDGLRWDRLYAGALGLIDNVGILITRDGQLNPQPFGTQLLASTTLRAYDFYGQDTWRIRPSLTFTYGLAYGWQTTPHEKDGKQTFIIDNTTGKIINGQDYINAKEAAALNGQTYNPQLAYLPIRKSGRSDVFSVDYGDWAPRVSLAWSPSYKGGLFGRLFGDRKAVIRGGYGVSYDRLNTVQSVIIPMLGVGFAQTINVVTPACNATGSPGPGCNPADSNPAASVFRVGQDGAIPLPAAPTALKSPVVPSLPFGEILSFQNDPDFKVGREHMLDFSIQREMPGNMLIEAGYVGRLGRNLPNSINFNSSPYMFVDPGSKQSFAQAFDAVATEVRNNQPVTSQPWFENQLPGLGAAFGAPNSTALMAAINTSAFEDGLVSTLFLTMNFLRFSVLGLPTYNNLQVFDLFMRTHRDISNYHAFVLTLRKRPSHGLQFNLNYTLSKSLDQVGAVQNSASYYASSFNRRLEYGPSFFDHRHIFNALVNYDLPAGRGHRFAGSNRLLDKVFGGWYVADVFRANSGEPLTVSESAEVFGGGSIFAFPSGEIPLAPTGTLGAGLHSAVTYSPGCESTGGAGNPTCGGSGLNLFADPNKALKSFRKILISKDGRTGRANPFYGLGLWNLDMRVGKYTAVTERVKVHFSADFINIFNHVNFQDPTFDATNPATFGAITDEFIPAQRLSGSRWIEMGLRIEF